MRKVKVSKKEIKRVAREALYLWRNAKDLYTVVSLKEDGGKEKLWVGYSTYSSGYDAPGEVLLCLPAWDFSEVFWGLPKRYWLRKMVELIENALIEHETRKVEEAIRQQYPHCDHLIRNYGDYLEVGKGGNYETVWIGEVWVRIYEDTPKHLLRDIIENIAKGVKP